MRNGARFASIGILCCGLALTTVARAIDRDPARPETRGGELNVVPGIGLVVPFRCAVIVKAVGGSAGATSEFGLGTTPRDFKPLIAGLPSKPLPADGIRIGRFAAGSAVPLALRTVWGRDTHHAFATSKAKASLCAFGDTDGDRGKGGILERTGPKVWRLHLDDAASLKFDDNDGDIVLEIRLVPAP